MTKELIEQFDQTESTQDIQKLHEIAAQEGYSWFRLLLDQFQQNIKTFEDDQIEIMFRRIAKAKKMFPKPRNFSPAWERIWDEFELMIRYKAKAMETIAPSERDGEWQIVMDNPSTNEQVVCYPGLSFLEAAYLYGYFHVDLKKNEYIRMQKIQTVIMNFGS